jgi:hypothetical protein
MIDLLTPQEAAAILKVSPKAVATMCARGNLPGARKVLRFWRIPAAALTEYFDIGSEQEEAHPRTGYAEQPSFGTAPAVEVARSERTDHRASKNAKRRAFLATLPKSRALPKDPP